MYRMCNNCSADSLFTAYSNACRAYVYSTLFLTVPVECIISYVDNIEYGTSCVVM